MAKKKDIEVVDTGASPAIAIIDRLRKKYGVDNIEQGNYIIDRPKKRLSVCPSIDLNLGGGIQEGTISLISGKPKSGKTTLCLQIAKSAIEDGRDVFYLAVENRFSEANARGIEGLDPKKINVVKSEMGKILSGEDFLDIARDIAYEVPSAVIIIDSTSGISPREEAAEGITGKGRALAPRMFSEWCKSVAPVIPANNTMVLAIQHVITNTSGYGAGFSEDGGLKLKFQSDLLLRAGGFEKWTTSSGKLLGQKVFWQVVWSNHVGAKVDKFESFLRYGIGFDIVKETINLAIELGAVKQAGAWYSFAVPVGELSDAKFQGEDGLWKALHDNPEALGMLKQSVYGVLEQ